MIQSIQTKSKAIFATLLLSFVCATTSAQTAEVKFNVASAVVTIINPSIEVGFASHSAITFDYVGAYAEEDLFGTGYPMMCAVNLFGYRHYLKSDCHSGLFFGGDFGFNLYRMNKNVVPLVANDKYEDSYEVGHGVILGVTIGYKYPISRRFSLEASVSGGWQHAYHEGYLAGGVRDVTFNASGEWLPYKAGLYLNYKLW